MVKKVWEIGDMAVAFIMLAFIFAVFFALVFIFFIFIITNPLLFLLILAVAFGTIFLVFYLRREGYTW